MPSLGGNLQEAINAALRSPSGKAEPKMKGQRIMHLRDLRADHAATRGVRKIVIVVMADEGRRVVHRQLANKPATSRKVPFQALGKGASLHGPPTWQYKARPQQVDCRERLSLAGLLSQYKSTAPSTNVAGTGPTKAKHCHPPGVGMAWTILGWCVRFQAPFLLHVLYVSLQRLSALKTAAAKLLVCSSTAGT